jgi:hypothetical protein
MGIAIGFLKEQRKALAKMDEKLETIMQNLKEMGDDIKYLRGKSVQELLELRKKEV